MAVPAGKAVVETGVKDNTRAGVAGISKRFTNLSKKMAVLSKKAAMGAAAIGAPLILAAKKFASTGDQIDKLSKRTGIGTDAAQAFGFAMEQSGGSIEQLEPALKRFNSLLLDAQRGLPTAKREFQSLGLAISDLETLPVEDQFRRIVETLGTIENENERAAIAVRVFGKSGTAVLPLLGSLKDLEKEFEGLGSRMSKEDVQAAANLNDAFNKLKHQFTAIVVKIGSALAPSLTRIANDIGPIIKQVIKFAEENGSLVVTLGKVAGALGIVSLAMKALSLSNPFTAAITGAILLLDYLDQINKKMGQTKVFFREGEEGFAPNLRNLVQEGKHLPGKKFIEDMDPELVAKRQKAAQQEAARGLEKAVKMSKESLSILQRGFASLGDKVKPALNVARLELANLFQQKAAIPPAAITTAGALGAQALGIQAVGGAGSPIENLNRLNEQQASILNDIKFDIAAIRNEGLV